MNLGYLVPRVMRHVLPERLTRFLLLRSMIIKPGLETVDPAAAVDRYAEVLALHHDSLSGKRIMVFGYGGRFDVGVGLLAAGAARVALCDRFARPDHGHNARLLANYGDWLRTESGVPRPRPERMELVEADVRAIDPPASSLRYDLVLSNSVYEHLDDAEGITRALGKWSASDGLHIHFVDLRDHYFTYPFEMLRYSERTWRRWLNPTSHHNRLRVWDYRRIFESHFRAVEIAILQRDEAAFERIRPHVRPEFISGDAAEDAVTLIRITARSPRN
ncbi:MAG: hypothetical protein V1755_04895 [Chloroflexota bacterium]